MVDHWMRGFVGKLMGLLHEVWLGINFDKASQATKTVTIRSKDKLLKEADRLGQLNFQNIEDKHRVE